MVLTVLFTTACTKGSAEKSNGNALGSVVDDLVLTGNDLIAYNVVLETVCYKTNNPSKVVVISGTISSDYARLIVSVDGEKTAYLHAVQIDGEKYTDIGGLGRTKEHYATDSFNAAKVNQALKKKWAH